MQHIIPFLWFHDRAEQAMDFYPASSSNSGQGRSARHGEGGPGPQRLQQARDRT